MELDTESYIIEEYLDSVLSKDIRKIIFKYGTSNLIQYIKVGDFYLMDLYLRRLYDISYNRLKYKFKF